jgi:hypothetical protein
MIEVVISGKQRQIVLHYKCRYPDIIGGNRGSLATQLEEELSVLVRCHLGGIENGYTLPIEKSTQDTFILPRFGSAQKSSAQFRQDDKGQKNLFGSL